MDVNLFICLCYRHVPVLESLTYPALGACTLDPFDKGRGLLWLRGSLIDHPARCFRIPYELRRPIRLQRVFLDVIFRSGHHLLDPRLILFDPSLRLAVTPDGFIISARDIHDVSRSLLLVTQPGHDLGQAGFQLLVLPELHVFQSYPVFLERGQLGAAILMPLLVRQMREGIFQIGQGLQLLLRSLTRHCELDLGLFRGGTRPSLR
jgi:hypothetical protein